MIDSDPAGRDPASTAHAASPPAPLPLPIAELEAQITELAGHLNAANHRWLVLIAEFDRREGWADGSTRSCAHWLSWKCGVDLGAAREKVRVARALEALPKISAAMAGGEQIPGCTVRSTGLLGLRTLPCRSGLKIQAIPRSGR